MQSHIRTVTLDGVLQFNEYFNSFKSITVTTNKKTYSKGIHHPIFVLNSIPLLG